MCAYVIYCCLYSAVQSSIVEILGLVASENLKFYPRPKIVEKQHGIGAYMSYFEGQ